MPIPTEPIGSVPRTADLLAAMRAHAAGKISAEQPRNLAAERSEIYREIGKQTSQLGYVGRDYKKPLQAIAAKPDKVEVLRRSYGAHSITERIPGILGPMAFSLETAKPLSRPHIQLLRRKSVP
jgi:hypothetical protein